jgi:peptidyl-prolyl cis-trans isomerase C
VAAFAATFFLTVTYGFLSMKSVFRLLLCSLWVLSLLFTSQIAVANDVLVSVEDLKITKTDLEKALNSSPMYTQFNTLGETQQASVRGSLLQRLVASRLMLLEALDKGLDKSDQYQQELERFRLGMLHRRYIGNLRDSIRIPDEILEQMKGQFRDNHDAYIAAQSAYISEKYKHARIQEIIKLRQRYHVYIYEDRLLPTATPETVLLEGDGIRITYSDLPIESEKNVSPEWIQTQLYNRAELVLTARAAEDEGMDVSKELESFRSERLPSLLMENLQREWLPDETPLTAYYNAHPQLSHTLQRRHIGQLVVATRKEAEDMRKRILSGDSLFKLAAKYSIDPYGRQNYGDMGWIKEDRGNPKINAAIADLEDGEVSDIVETPLGYHLVTILERKPGESRPYHTVKDKVQQLFLSEKLTTYLKSLEQKYKVVWNLPTHNQQ